MQRGLMGSLNTKKSPLTKRGARTPLLTLPKKARLERFTQKNWPLLLEGSTPNLPSHPLVTVGGACGKGNGVDFDTFAEPPVQRGMFGPSIVVGLAAFQSSSWGLSAVAKEYLERALMLYEEFLSKGLSHTLVRHALLVSGV
ncbi:hypothetical protein ACOSQ3_018470 [Xanthoceras sorbifolium]